MRWQQTIMTILKYAWVVWLIHGHEPETIGLLDGVLPTKAAGYQDVRQVVGVARMMEIAWKSPEEKLAIGLIYGQKNSFLFFLFGKQFQAFLKGRSGDVIPKGSLVLGKSALIFTSLICNTLQEQIPITFPIIFQGSTCYSFSLFRPQRCGTGHSIRTVLALLHGCGCCGV